MKVKTKEFSVALGRVLQVIKTRTTIPILTCVKLSSLGGKLHVTASDLDVFASANCPCTEDEPGIACCVSADMIKQLAHQPIEELELTVKGDWLTVKGNGSARLGVQPTDDFPKWPDTEGIALDLEPAELSECVKGVCWASNPTGKVITDHWMEAIWLQLSHHGIECCCTDGKEFAYVNKPIKLAAVNKDVGAMLMFPVKAAKILIDALDTGANKIVLGNSHLCATGDTIDVAIHLMQGKYIPVDFILRAQQTPLGPLGSVEVAPILDSLQMIKALAGEEPWINVRFEFQESKCTLVFQGKASNFDREFPCSFTGKPVGFSVDGIRAIRVLRHLQPGAKAGLTDGTVLFLDGDWTYALALLLG